MAEHHLKGTVMSSQTSHYNLLMTLYMYNNIAMSIQYIDAATKGEISIWEGNDGSSIHISAINHGDFTGYYRPSGDKDTFWPAVGKFDTTAATDSMASVGWVARSPNNGSSISTFCGQFSEHVFSKPQFTMNGTNVMTGSSIGGDPPTKACTVLYTYVPAP